MDCVRIAGGSLCGFAVTMRMISIEYPKRKKCLESAVGKHTKTRILSFGPTHSIQSKHANSARDKHKGRKTVEIR